MSRDNDGANGAPFSAWAARWQGRLFDSRRVLVRSTARHMWEGGRPWPCAVAPAKKWGFSLCLHLLAGGASAAKVILARRVARLLVILTNSCYLLRAVPGLLPPEALNERATASSPAAAASDNSVVAGSGQKLDLDGPRSTLLTALRREVRLTLSVAAWLCYDARVLAVGNGG